MKYEIEKIFRNFEVSGDLVEFSPIVSGHINDTFLIKTADDSFVLQRINHNVFKNPAEVVKNKILVVEHLKSKEALISNSGRQMLNFMKSRSGGHLYVDETGNAWNLMRYIENSRVYLKSPDSKIAFEAGKAFGSFLALTEDLDPSLLFETLPRFHSMSLRYSQFDEALKSAAPERISQASDLIETAHGLRGEMHILERWVEEGTLPFRVTHNDTKISNALFSEDGIALCVIDLDTVMPGIVHYDFGDAVRTICGTADEDEPELANVDFNLEYYKSFVRGFVGTSGIRLTKAEAKGLARSAKVMTFIVGLRFLTDFLNNDIYFDTRYETHNLVRARNQFRLASLIEKNLPALNEIVMKEFDEKGLKERGEGPERGNAATSDDGPRSTQH